MYLSHSKLAIRSTKSGLLCPLINRALTDRSYATASTITDVVPTCNIEGNNFPSYQICVVGALDHHQFNMSPF